MLFCKHVCFFSVCVKCMFTFKMKQIYYLNIVHKCMTHHVYFVLFLKKTDAWHYLSTNIRKEEKRKKKEKIGKKKGGVNRKNQEKKERKEKVWTDIESLLQYVQTVCCTMTVKNCTLCYNVATFVLMNVCLTLIFLSLRQTKTYFIIYIQGHIAYI